VLLQGVFGELKPMNLDLILGHLYDGWLPLFTSWRVGRNMKKKDEARRASREEEDIRAIREE